ncbi:hypothetical protein [Lactiplantibacillus plajomi]|uniref:DNA-binding protein n=1 Tax=Lactiplantibacillus plajomi TaxID=1457217 RepID=A0ABV6K0S1_9LACO|nr:hypothetical protein [Lactiplantibacillus plajomi]
MNIGLDPESTRRFLDRIVNRIAVALLPAVRERLLGDELLNKSELGDWLGVSPTILTKSFLTKPGFPYYMVGSDRRYWKRAVIKYLDEHQEFSD